MIGRNMLNRRKQNIIELLPLIDDLNSLVVEYVY